MPSRFAPGASFLGTVSAPLSAEGLSAIHNRAPLVSSTVLSRSHDCA